MVASDERRWLSVGRLGADPQTHLDRLGTQRLSANTVYTWAHRSRLGDLSEIEDVVSRFGLLPPMVALLPRRGWIVLGGERRFAAWVGMYGGNRVPVYVANVWADFLAWMLVDIDQRGTRQRMSLVEAVTLVDKVAATLDPRKHDYADQTIAEYLDLRLDLLRTTRYLTNWLEHESPEVVELAKRKLDQVAGGELGPSAAYDHVKALAERVAAGEGMPTETQRKILNNAVTTLAGVTDGLQGLGGLANNLAPGECEAWAKSLSKARLELERTIRKLKERAKQ